MVGGYVLLFKMPLVLGDNDIAAMYGSLENANNRGKRIIALQKPILVEYIITVAGVNTKVSTWFAIRGQTGVTLTLTSAIATITYNTFTGIAELTLHNN